MTRPRVALAHDYLTQRGGAERLVLSLVKAFPDAKLYTTVYNPEATYPEFRDVDIVTSPLNKVPLFRRDPRYALPLLAAASSRLRVDADVMIASTTGWAHGFAATGKRIVYCNSPARWLYLPEDYLSDEPGIASAALRLLRPGLVRWDQRAARKADRYFGNSTVVVDRIRQVYGGEVHPELLFPAVSVSADAPQQPVPEVADWVGKPQGEGFGVVVARLQPYKNVDKLIRAVTGTARKLVVVGHGPEEARLRAMAGPETRMLKNLTDAQMRYLYAECEALIACSHEDFGLTPLEAGVFGKPTFALRAGGYLDTVVEGESGFFFDEPETDQIRLAIRSHREYSWDPDRIRELADRFSEERFIGAVRAAVDDLVGPIRRTT